MYLVTAAEMRQLDLLATTEVGIPSLLLMENAGRSISESILTRLGELEAPCVVILVGPGNNGGDGSVIARHLLQAGADVSVILCADRARIKGDAKTNLDIVEKLGIPITALIDASHVPAAESVLERAEVLVDALLGLGLESELRGPCRLGVEVSAFVDAYRVAVDIPTGIHADTGQVMGDAFLADLTVSCGLPKHGNLHFPGAGYSGEMEVVDIGIPSHILAKNLPNARVLSEMDLVLPSRAQESHKGTHGHILVFGGTPGKSGAALLATSGAFRSGAGLVTLATDVETRNLLDGKAPEVMIEVFREDAEALPEEETLQKLIEGKNAIVVGPGLGDSSSTGALVEILLRISEVPMVLDADALNVVVGKLEQLEGARGDLILTPHPGEMARLLETDTDGVQSDRSASARRLAQRTRSSVVLKGAHSVVSGSGESLSVVLTGNPGMAAAGCGDVLAGMIGALSARMSPCSAVELGTYLHGLAGDLGADEKGVESLTAMDVVTYISAAWFSLDSVLESREL
jgi:hydroxyethylthiazole kinase-like uncharacterized protein yjeF